MFKHVGKQTRHARCRHAGAQCIAQLACPGTGSPCNIPERCLDKKPKHTGRCNTPTSEVEQDVFKDGCSTGEESQYPKEQALPLSGSIFIPRWPRLCRQIFVFLPTSAYLHHGRAALAARGPVHAYLMGGSIP
eukprot:1160023-Pelagomonas_calceolata.AAC.4